MITNSDDTVDPGGVRKQDDKMSRKRSHLGLQLKSFQTSFMQRLPQHERAVLEEFLANPNEPHPARVFPVAGDPAPDFTLPDQHGVMVSLGERLKNGPVILLFVRGGWCPFSALTLRGYQGWLPEIHDEGAELLAITPQPAWDCGEIAERDLLAFPTLSDQGNQVAELFGIRSEMFPALRPMHKRLGHALPEINGTGDWSIPLPATFVIGADGHVARSHIGQWASDRLEPSDALAILRALPAEARGGVIV